MKLTTQTLEADLAREIESETGVKVLFSPAYDSFSSFLIRTRPMESGVANQLADYLSRDLEAGENIKTVQVQALESGVVSIRASGISGPVGNLFRLLQGDKPGLTIGDIVFASGVLYEQKTSRMDGNVSIVIEKNAKSASGVRNHIRQALISYIQDMAKKRESAFAFDEDTGVSSILAPPVGYGSGVDGAYAALNQMLHRDRCIPIAYGQNHFTDSVYLIGGAAIGMNPQGSRNPETVLLNVEEALRAARAPEAEVTDQARMLLLHGYERKIQEEYPDLSNILLSLCASRTGVLPLYRRAQDALPAIEQHLLSSTPSDPMPTPATNPLRPVSGPTL